MVPELENLVRFIGEDEGLVARVREAVEWVASTPEGLAKLEEARALHGKPLDIITDPCFGLREMGYTDLHGIPVNPDTVKAITMLTDDGRPVTNSLERYFSHEFVHATQPSLAMGARANAEAAKWLENPPIPLDRYMHRLQVTQDDGELRELFGEIYDEHLAPHVRAVQDFHEQYEVPAINFENLMMTKYRGELPRSTIQRNSAEFEQVLPALGREDFIDGAMGAAGATHAQKAKPLPSGKNSASERIGGRNPQEVRSDAGAKSQEPNKKGS